MCTTNKSLFLLEKVTIFLNPIYFFSKTEQNGGWIISIQCFNAMLKLVVLKFVALVIKDSKQATRTASHYFFIQKTCNAKIQGVVSN